MGAGNRESGRTSDSLLARLSCSANGQSGQSIACLVSPCRGLTDHFTPVKLAVPPQAGREVSLPGRTDPFNGSLNRERPLE